MWTWPSGSPGEGGEAGPGDYCGGWRTYPGAMNRDRRPRAGGIQRVRVQCLEVGLRTRGPSLGGQTGLAPRRTSGEARWGRGRWAGGPLQAAAHRDAPTAEPVGGGGGVSAVWVSAPLWTDAHGRMWAVGGASEPRSPTSLPAWPPHCCHGLHWASSPSSRVQSGARTTCCLSISGRREVSCGLLGLRCPALSHQGLAGPGGGSIRVLLPDGLARGSNKGLGGES